MLSLALHWGSFEGLLTCTRVLFCISTVVPAAEYLFIGQAFRPQGVLAGEMLATNDAVFQGIPARLTNALYSYPVFVAIQLARIMLCIGLLVLPASLSGCLLGALTVISLLFLYRNPLGNDGSDQMNMIICIALTILYLQPTNLAVAKMSIYFIATQALLSYFVAGTAKLLSTDWRSGRAIKAIMNTRTYGNAAIARYLNQDRRQWLNVALCWSIIGMEMAFPLVLFLPAPYFWLLIGWGVCFHLYNAAVMGLNVFFWAFLATYPSVLFLRLSIASQ